MKTCQPSITYYPLSIDAYQQITKSELFSEHDTPIKKFTPITIGNTQAYTFQSGGSGQGTVVLPTRRLSLRAADLLILFYASAQ